MKKYAVLARKFITQYRPEVSFHQKPNYSDKTILVTGGGGSIGSEICREIVKLNPFRLIILDSCENNLFNIERELDGKARITTSLLDLRNKDNIHSVLQEYRTDVIFHAAAYKHVSMVEKHPLEGLENNFIVTRNLAACARQYNVGSFVFVSTDKAVYPGSIMGATKRAAELLITDMSANYGPKFTCVRLGNVLGSSGSVMEIFDSQVSSGGPVTVTNEAMERFFVTSREAAGLAIEADRSGETGDTYIMDMGKPIKVLDLAKFMIGDTDTNIKFTQPYWCEKAREDITYDYEIEQQTNVRGVMCVKRPVGRIHPDLFHRLSASRSTFEVKKALSELTGDYILR